MTAPTFWRSNTGAVGGPRNSKRRSTWAPRRCSPGWPAPTAGGVGASNGTTSSPSPTTAPPNTPTSRPAAGRATKPKPTATAPPASSNPTPPALARQARPTEITQAARTSRAKPPNRKRRGRPPGDPVADPGHPQGRHAVRPPPPRRPILPATCPEARRLRPPSTIHPTTGCRSVRETPSPNLDNRIATTEQPAGRPRKRAAGASPSNPSCRPRPGTLTAISGANNRMADEVVGPPPSPGASTRDSRHRRFDAQDSKGMPSASDRGPDGIEVFARAAAAVAGLRIEEAWWPEVLGHLAGLVAAAASVEEVTGITGDLPDEPAPVFRP